MLYSSFDLKNSLIFNRFSWKISSDKLLLQSCLTKLVKLNFSGKILPYEIFHFFWDRWLVAIFVDFFKSFSISMINFKCTMEKSRNVLLKHCKSLVQFFKNPDDTILSFYRKFCSIKCSFTVELSAEISKWEELWKVTIKFRVNLQTFFVVTAEKFHHPPIVWVIVFTLDIITFFVISQYTSFIVFSQPLRFW